MDLGTQEPITRRQYLMMRAMMDGCPVQLVREAVATTALSHPEWDMEEQRSWQEWERMSA
jgi:hypothetical protein